MIALAPNDDVLAKTNGNIKEVKARGAIVTALTNNGTLASEADFSIALPKASLEHDLYPFALIVPLQFLAYYTCLNKEYNPDKPRNLAKSVTVE